MICSGQMQTACCLSLYCYLVACALIAEQLVSLLFWITNGGWLTYNTSLRPFDKDEYNIFPFHYNFLFLKGSVYFGRKNQSL